MINIEMLSNRGIRGTHRKKGEKLRVSPGRDIDYMINRGMCKVVEPKKAKPDIK